MFEFDWENTWREYKEFALLPTILFYADQKYLTSYHDSGKSVQFKISDVYKYYGIIFQFLNIKMAVSVRKQWKSN